MYGGAVDVYVIFVKSLCIGDIEVVFYVSFL